jgi:valyl-tRNA synthetase
LKDGRRDNGERIVVATTRPETMFGDIAIAVNPSDTRYVIGLLGVCLKSFSLFNFHLA